VSLTRRVTPLLLATLALTACRESPRTAVPASGAPAASAAPTAGHTAASSTTLPGAKDSAAASAGSDRAYRLQVEGVETPNRPALHFTLVAASAPGPDGTLRLSAIEVRRAGAAELVQRLDGLDTQTPTTAGGPILEQIDMDFDGIPDMRVVESIPAGPNVPYRNWRYDRASGRFVASAELDELTSPVFDAQRREVRSDWRDGAARYGTDTLTWRDGRLAPQRRVTREAGSTGKVTQRTYSWSGGGWVVDGANAPRQP
jgi:hypothetical protein